MNFRNIDLSCLPERRMVRVRHNGPQIRRGLLPRQQSMRALNDHGARDRGVPVVSSDIRGKVLRLRIDVRNSVAYREA